MMKTKSILNFLVLLAISILVACSNEDEKNSNDGITNPILNAEKTGRDVILRIRRFSSSLKEPYCAFSPGCGEIFTNIFVDETNWKIYLTDSLSIKPRAIVWFDTTFTKKQLTVIYDSVEAIKNPEEMIDYLGRKGVFFRSMNIDSLSIKLSRKLVGWSINQYPPQVLFQGSHTFIYSGSNAGGYSWPTERVEGIQSLRFFYRNSTISKRESLLSLIDSSLTFEQLKNVLSPEIQLEKRDTYWGDQ
ncbi:MAG: hypothetical protein LCH54_00770 [Bacteroidetes bacterium]|nr:hypothetical protein [Bacteroidota bacterium]